MERNITIMWLRLSVSYRVSTVSSRYSAAGVWVGAAVSTTSGVGASASFITDVSSFVVIRYKYVMGLMLVSEFRSAKVGCFEEMIS